MVSLDHISQVVYPAERYFNMLPDRDKYKFGIFCHLVCYNIPHIQIVTDFSFSVYRTCNPQLLIFTQTLVY